MAIAPVRPSGNAVGAPKGSENYLTKLEGYATALEQKVASLYHAHTVIATGVIGFFVGVVVKWVF